MKPDWKDAPQWAQWLAQDEDGDWNWFEVQPRRALSPSDEVRFWCQICGTRSEWARTTPGTDLWSDTLEERS